MFRIVPQLTVKSVSDSVKFYTESLGFTTSLLDPPDNPVFASLEREDAALFLVSEGSREEQYQLNDLKANKHGVGVRLYFEVDDARELYERLVSAEVPILREIAYNENEDYTEFSLPDPDGYEIGIYS
jgi:catechol 2,3-dioxygenase-like lactoylglutathione lyase family enzyme